jgi:gentisate 1,2-dioxygenase
VTPGKRIVDLSGAPAPEIDFWEPVIFTAEEIDEEIERLAGIPRPRNGRRESAFVHPAATAPGLGLAPGIGVTLSVLLPGERTEAIRHNSTQIVFCIRGSGSSVVGGHAVTFRRHDVFNIPSFRTYWHTNDSDGVQVRLCYSNAPLLEKLQVHLVEERPPEEPRVPARAADTRRGRSSPFGTIQLDEGGAMLMPYELLIAPPPLESPVLHWPWAEVKDHLDQLDALGAEYLGRRLYLLYNPSTGRTNGTTPSFFSTITIRPPGIVDRPHRHVSAAINYYFKGRGYSRVLGQRYHWKAGDLMLSAPGWATHFHASEDEQVYELTVQDQPLNIAMESLLWQEDLNQDAVVLGSEPGFATNRGEVAS